MKKSFFSSNLFQIFCLLFFIIAVSAAGGAVISKEPKLFFSNTELKQGDSLIIKSESILPIRAQFGSKPAYFFCFHKKYFSIIGIGSNAGTGKSLFSAKSFLGRESTRELDIARRDFPVTKFIVPEKLAMRGVSAASLVKSVEANDEAVITSIFKIFTPEIAFSEPFGEPLKKWNDVGNFGILRQFNGGSIRHVGVDLDADPGDPVYSINSGTVRFAGELKNFGNTVLIDHGMGIFSGYLHLDEIKVDLNSGVKKGEIIGSVGSTGEYSLSPHLHFTVKILGVSVDPRKFLDAAEKFLR